MDIKRIWERLFFPCIVGLFIVSLSLPVYAETQYVSDHLIITMREGRGNEYKIIKTLDTGTPVTVIEEMEQYYRVRTDDGKEGWVLKRYITPDTPKERVIAGLQGQIENLRSRIDELNKERDSFKRDLQAAKSEHSGEVVNLQNIMNEKNAQISSLTRQLQEMTDKYNKLVEDSGDVVKIVDERDMLLDDNKKLVAERNDLKQENERLFEKKMIYWFLAGAGVFFFGWMSGKFSRKKKRFY